jgi:membrane-bound lytic murein transglycosylase D
MLKRKLITTVLFVNGLLVILVAVHAMGMQPMVNFTQKPINDSTIQWLSLNEELLQFNGLTGEIADEAPKIGLRKEALRFANSYLEKNAELLEQIRKKSPRYFQIMDTVFTRYNLPVELKHLAIVESELNPKARSRVGALGPWQLMPSTARILNLKVNGRTDERTHFYKSTVAAAKYLRDLYKIFDDWLLVIAAYNSGPGPVLKAIKKSGSRNFWKLQYYLPAETRGHVKKYISTHYFYEGNGGVTTLTKYEAGMQRKTMLAFAEKHNKLMREKQEALLNEKSIEDSTAGDDKILATVQPVVAIKPEE